MPIMKLPIHNGQSAWIPFPHTVYTISDQPSGDSYITMDPSPNSFAGYTVKGVSARDLKRSIQENVDEHIGFLKMNVADTTMKIYVNVSHVKSIDSVSAKKARIHARASEYAWVVAHDPAQLALQLRRIVKRMDQDEEICCTGQDEGCRRGRRSRISRHRE